ncbi:hypothetical protein MASR2M8_01680 [Opitutaceae bacterium]
MTEPESTDLQPHVSMRSLVLGGMLAMVGVLFFAGLQAEPSLRATRILTSVSIAGAAGGAAYSMLGPWRESATHRKFLRQAASAFVYSAAVVAGFIAARFGPF